MSSTEGQVTRRSWRSARRGHLADQGRLATAPTATGLRRVDWVRLVVDDDSVRAEAVGVGYRLPTTRPIPLSVAVALIAGGTPSVTRGVGARSVEQAAHPNPPSSPDGGM
jgi:hypothetical protein